MIKVKTADPETFDVTVEDHGGRTVHCVTLSEDVRRRLASDRKAEECVAAAFRFLLDREPKESILPRFDLMVIARYFPEFEHDLERYF